MLVRTMYLSALLLLCFASCQKHTDDIDGIPNQASTKNTNAAPTNVFDTCHCSADSTEFIKGVFNGVPMCFNTPAVFSDSFGNAYYYKAGMEDQINLIRQNNSGTMLCSFYFLNTDLYHQALPYVMPHPNLAYCEHIELALLDFRQPWASQCQGCDIDNADYFGNTWNHMSVTVTDTTGGYVRGIFTGSSATKTGLTLQVSDGSFNIHLYKEPMDDTTTTP